MSDWDPDQYRKFDAERSRPLWDLVDLVERGDGHDIARMVDLGCGDGELTVAAADRVGAVDVVGIDSSPAMIERTAGWSSPSRRFELGDLATWTSDGDVDLVFANASLQWTPDHAGVLARWREALAPGGQLAVQVPTNGDHPSHVVIDEVAHASPFVDAFRDGVPPNPVVANVLAPETYAALFDELGFTRQHVRMQVYVHHLESTASIVEWVRGTNLNRIFAALPAELHEPFVEAYRAALIDRIGDLGPYVYTFKRILMWGARPR